MYVETQYFPTIPNVRGFRNDLHARRVLYYCCSAKRVESKGNEISSDGRNPANQSIQLRLVAYPIVYRVWYIQTVVVNGISERTVWSGWRVFLELTSCLDLVDKS